MLSCLPGMNASPAEWKKAALKILVAHATGCGIEGVVTCNPCIGAAAILESVLEIEADEKADAVTFAADRAKGVR